MVALAAAEAVVVVASRDTATNVGGVEKSAAMITVITPGDVAW